MSEAEFRERLIELVAGLHRIGIRTNALGRPAPAKWFGEVHRSSLTPCFQHISEHIRLRFGVVFTTATA